MTTPRETTFIRADEFLLIKNEYPTLKSVVIEEVDCNRTFTRAEALEYALSFDDVVAVYRAGSEGLQDVTDELARLYMDTLFDFGVDDEDELPEWIKPQYDPVAFGVA
jgi:hypothetical protein